MTDMHVRVVGWSAIDAVALVDGIRCRIRRNTTTVRWLCDEHGEGQRPHCPHLQAFASAPADPKKENNPC